MAKHKTNDLKQKISGMAPMPSAAQGLVQPAGFVIRYPLLWLAAAVIIVYFPTFSMGLTDLDDGIIINTLRDYNENLHNLITSFSRSAYGTSGDVMYRPVPADIMILNYQIEAKHMLNIGLDVPQAVRQLFQL